MENNIWANESDLGDMQEVFKQLEEDTDDKDLFDDSEFEGFDEDNSELGDDLFDGFDDDELFGDSDEEEEE